MRRIILVFMLAALVAVTVAGTAWAKPFTETTIIKHFTETFTNHYLDIAKGSDGSRLHQNLLFRYSLNANGKMNFVVRFRDCAF